MQEIGPHEGVLPSVGHLIHTEIEWRAKVESNKVVGVCLVEQRYLMLGTKRADKGGGVVGLFRHMCRRAKPGQPH